MGKRIDKGEQMIEFEYVGKDGDVNDYYTITGHEGFLIGYLENRNKK